jgi:aminopeptidase N
MRADALADVQQLTSVVASSAEVEGMFSSISYSKGGSLLRMLERFLGSDVFFRGFAAYVKKNEVNFKRQETGYVAKDHDDSKHI